MVFFFLAHLRLMFPMVIPFLSFYPFFFFLQIINYFLNRRQSCYFMWFGVLSDQQPSLRSILLEMQYGCTDIANGHITVMLLQFSLSPNYEAISPQLVNSPRHVIVNKLISVELCQSGPCTWKYTDNSGIMASTGTVQIITAVSDKQHRIPIHGGMCISVQQFSFVLNTWGQF